MGNFENITELYLNTLSHRRSVNASEDTIRQDFLNYLKEAFPNLRTEEVDLEKTVKLQSHGAGARVQHGFIDAVYGDLIFEFKKELSDNTKSTGEEELEKYLRSQVNPEKYFGLLSDGETVILYALRDGNLCYISEFIISLDNLDETKLRFDVLLFQEHHITPTGKDIALRFGVDSPSFWGSINTLENMWDSIKKNADIKTKYSQWQKLLAIVYGETIDSEDLFLKHTYLDFFSRLLVLITLQMEIPRSEKIKDIISGEVFNEIGIPNLVTESFFNWLEDPSVIKEAVRLISGIANRLAHSYDFHQINEDLLKTLYQELVDPETRHDLGEFYTPDWLAERVFKEIKYPITDENGIPFDNEKNSLLDPACGSGTFLFVAIKRLRDQGLVGNDLIAFIQNHIAGIDIHPLAVTISKANILLALGDEISHWRSSFYLPVYMADALSVAESTLSIPMIKVEVDIEKLKEYSGKTADSQMPRAFHIPFPRNADTGYFNELVEDLIIYSDPEFSDDQTRQGFTNRLKRLLPESEKIEEHLSYWLMNLRLMKWMLSEPKTNSVWKFILKNAIRPQLLAHRKFDFIVGNPPWLAYRYINSSIYKDRIRRLVFEEGLLDRSKTNLITQIELGTIFFSFCNWYYLKNKGCIAFVLPRSIMTGAKQHIEFQKKYIQKATMLLDLKAVEPLFNIPSCVLIFEEGNESKKNVPRIKMSGSLPAHNLKLSNAEEYLNEETSSYNLLSYGKKSDYFDKYFQGATINPRALWFVKPHKEAKLVDKKTPYVNSDPFATRFAKNPWNIEVKGQIEADFLFSTLLSRELFPFFIRKLCLIVLPLINNSLQTKEELLVNGYPKLSKWIENNENLWSEIGKSNMSLYERIDYQNTLISQNQNTNYKVIYGGSGTNIVSSIIKKADIDNKEIYDLSTNGFIADSTLYYYETDDELEAYYLNAYLNSPFVNDAIKPYQTQGAFGATTGGGQRHVHRRPFEVLAFPKFHPSNERHLRLSGLGKKAESTVIKWVEDNPEVYEKFWITLRDDIREVIQNILNEIDMVVEEILEKDVSDGMRSGMEETRQLFDN